MRLFGINNFINIYMNTKKEPLLTAAYLIFERNHGKRSCIAY